MTKKDMYQGALGWLLTFLLFILVVTSIKYYFTSKTEIEALNVQLDYYEKVLNNQVKRSISNQAKLDNQQYMNTWLNNRLESNLEGINNNTRMIVNTRVEMDQISHESCETIIIELQEDIKRIEKRLK